MKIIDRLKNAGSAIRRSNGIKLFAGVAVLLTGIHLENRAVVSVGQQLLNKELQVDIPQVTVIEKTVSGSASTGQNPMARAEAKTEDPIKEFRPLKNLGRAIFGPSKRWKEENGNR